MLIDRVIVILLVAALSLSRIVDAHPNFRKTLEPDESEDENPRESGTTHLTMFHLRRHLLNPDPIRTLKKANFFKMAANMKSSNAVDETKKKRTNNMMMMGKSMSGTTDPSRSPCSSNPCQGAETCNPSDGSCSCEDPYIYINALCQEPENPCDSVICDDQDLCTSDSCDPLTGSCVNKPKDCDDQDLCTIDSCDATVGCVNERIASCCFNATDCTTTESCISSDTDSVGRCIDTTGIEVAVEQMKPLHLGFFDADVIAQVNQQSSVDIVPLSVQVSDYADDANAEVKNDTLRVRIDNEINQVVITGRVDSTDIVAFSDLQIFAYYSHGIVAGKSRPDPLTGEFFLVIPDIPFGSSSFLLAAVSSNIGSQRRQLQGQRKLWDITSAKNVDLPVYCTVSNSHSCGPPLTLTLNWDGPTSDIDLHVYEPGGAHVFYGNDIGDDGYLDFDDTDGFGPEHYIVNGTVETNVDYVAQIVAFSMGDDDAVRWSLEAHSLGSLLWTVSGELSENQTISDTIPIRFEEPLQCPCGDEESLRHRRNLATRKLCGGWFTSDCTWIDDLFDEWDDSRFAPGTELWVIESDEGAQTGTSVRGARCPIPFPLKKKCLDIGFLRSFYTIDWPCEDYFKPFAKGEDPALNFDYFDVDPDDSGLVEFYTRQYYDKYVTGDWVLFMTIRQATSQELAGLALILLAPAADDAIEKNAITLSDFMDFINNIADSSDSKLTCYKQVVHDMRCFCESFEKASDNLIFVIKSVRAATKFTSIYLKVATGGTVNGVVLAIAVARAIKEFLPNDTKLKDADEVHNMIEDGFSSFLGKTWDLFFEKCERIG